ncbi:MAG: DUF2017 domain-containing protein [Streptosporangiaceae bacterium]
MSIRRKRGAGDSEESGEALNGFRAVRGGGASATFVPSQAAIIRSLVSQIAELVGSGPGLDPASPETASADPDPAGAGPGRPSDPLDDLARLLGRTGPATPPDDPVLARLLPDAYTGDAEAAGDFRRFTEAELRDGKAAAARTVLATLPEVGGRIRLSEEEAQVWLRSLNDVRLALGVRLSITEDFEARVADLDPADPRSAYMWIYDWLTFLQETLVRALW